VVHGDFCQRNFRPGKQAKRFHVGLALEYSRGCRTGNASNGVLAWGARAQTAAVIDAQPNCISPQDGESGFDAGKKVKGRKRNLVVNTMGLLIALTVTAASVQGRDAAAVVAHACAKAPGLEKLYTDGRLRR
jgi:hypothetical protein